MNIITKNLGLSAILFAALTANAEAKEIHVSINTGINSHITQTYQCDDNSGSSKEETRTVATGSFSATTIKENVHNYSKCKLVNTSVSIRQQK